MFSLGTKTVLDAVIDMDLWIQALILQFTDLFLPTMSLWPPQFASWLIAVTSVGYWLDQSGSFFYAPLVEHVKRVSEERMVIVTGHSLGGGLAKIVSANVQIPAVCMSPPGISLISQKLEIEEADMYKRFISILPE